jgi:hypothetical protein
MKKKVLLIDNENIDATLESIEEEAMYDKELHYDVECLDWFNPVDRKFYADGEYSFDLARQELIETYLQKKIDVIGCDFNLHATNKTLTYDIIETIRTQNKSATIFIYSGGMNRSTLQMFGETGKKPAEKYLKVAMTSNISDYINNRNVIVENVVEMLKSPSTELQIEDFLMTFSSLTLSHTLEIFRGKQLFEIAAEIRKQTPLGKKFTKEIVSRGLSHYVDLNNYPSS